MSPSIDISETHKEIVQAILREHLANTCHVWVFGSRATWLAKAYSDLDLAIARKDGSALSLTVMSALETAFEDSLLPWKVDVIDLHSVSEEFRTAIERDRVLFCLGVGGEWVFSRLEEISEIIDSRHKTPSYSELGYPMVRVVDIKEGPLYLENTKKVKKNVYEDFSRGRNPKIGDLVISRVGSYGKVSYVSSEEKFCLGQNTALIVPKINHRFLYYQLVSPMVKSQIDKMVVGAVQKTISLKSIKQLEIFLPNSQEQKAIAHILGTLDDKIELNRQTNQTLEAMAQALFQSWFVDFDPVIDKALAAGNEIPEAFQAKAAARQALGDQRQALPEEVTALFPDAFVFTEEMGWIPEGWEVVENGNLFDVRDGTHDSPKQAKTGKYLITSRHITGNTIDFSKAYLISDTDFEQVNKRSAVNTYDILLTMIGTVGVPFLVMEKKINFAIKNIGLFKTNTDHAFAAFFYLYLKTDFMTQFLKSRMVGTTQLYLTLGNLRTLPVLKFPPKILKNFGTHVLPLFEKSHFNETNTSQLTTLRDTLLPKLISGELRVADAGGFLAEVGV